MVPIRPERLCEDAVIIDGIGGCGKTMLSAIIASLDRVEILKYSYEIEHACVMHHFGLLGMDSASYLVQYQLDLMTYNVMMGRDVNFRISDLSSVFNSKRKWRYVKRIFAAGDEAVPARISREKPILHLATHALSSFMRPIMREPADGLLFINMHRDPLFMLKQNTWNMGNLINTQRHFSMYYRWKGQAVPIIFFGREELLLNSPPKERAIFVMQWLRQRSIEATANVNPSHYYELTFESLVRNPHPHIDRICELLRTSRTAGTSRALKKERIPRTLQTDGRDRPIYRRVDWTRTEGRTPQEELDLLQQWAYDGISDGARDALDWLRADYENLRHRLNGTE